MKSQNNIECPKCGHTTCVFGGIDNWNNEDTDRVQFTPTSIKQKSFWRLIDRQVDLNDNGRITACYSCGHMWGNVDKEKLQSVLSSLEWNGELQTRSNSISLAILVERILILVVILLSLFIIFIYLKS